MRTYMSLDEILDISNRVLAPIAPFNIVFIDDNSIKHNWQNKFVLISKDSAKGRLEFSIDFYEYCYRVELLEKALNAHLQKVQEILNK